MSESPIKERPILFSAPMVRAILDGRKTQTRRIIKGDPVEVVHFIGADDKPKYDYYGFCASHRNVINKHIQCPYGQPGDRLWVRETFFASTSKIAADPEPERPVSYKATHEGVPPSRWLPSIHMPRWASRIVLYVINIQVERLHDISEEDALAEGIMRCTVGGVREYFENQEDMKAWPDDTPLFYDPDDDSDDALSFSAKEAYLRLWNRINGECAADENPWVWVIEFPKYVRPE